MATDLGSPARNSSNTGTVTISVVRNRAPSFDRSSYTGQINRDATDGAVITSFNVTDPDTNIVSCPLLLTHSYRLHLYYGDCLLVACSSCYCHHLTEYTPEKLYTKSSAELLAVLQCVLLSQTLWLVFVSLTSLTGCISSFSIITGRVHVPWVTAHWANAQIPRWIF